MRKKINEKMMENLHENLKSGDQQLLDIDSKAAKTLAKDFQSPTGKKLYIYENEENLGVRISINENTEQLSSETQGTVQEQW